MNYQAENEKYYHKVIHYGRECIQSVDYFVLISMFDELYQRKGQLAEILVLRCY